MGQYPTKRKCGSRHYLFGLNSEWYTVIFIQSLIQRDNIWCTSLHFKCYFHDKIIEAFTSCICEHIVIQVGFPCDICRYVNSGAAQKMALVTCEVVHYGLLRGKMVFFFFTSAIQMDRRVCIPGHFCVLIIYGERKRNWKWQRGSTKAHPNY